jgi:acyl carrier protein
MSTWTREEVLGKVALIIVETRGVNLMDVVEKANCFDDLGLESIDFLEISFRFEDEEEAFGFPLPIDDMSRTFDMTGVDGTPEMLEAKLVMFEQLFHTLVDRSKIRGISPFDREMFIKSMLDVFTVGVLVDFVVFKLRQRGRFAE